MPSFDTIEKHSTRYQLAKYYVDSIFRRYFRTEIVGRERLNRNKIYIFTPNHQGALMDALAILAIQTRWQPVFLARADIFKNPKIAKILYFLKILPIFRIRDGYESLTNNDKVFLKTMDVLRNKNGLVMLPEGNHGAFKRLRPLKKGVARIALQAVDASNGEMQIEIVPVGLDYSNYVNVRSHLLIRIGEPFGVNKYLDLYRRNNALAYNALIDELAEGIKKEMIHIETEDDYDAYMRLLEMFTPLYIRQFKLKRTRNQKFIIDKQLIAMLDNMRTSNPQQYSDIVAKLNFCDSTIKKHGLADNTAPFKYNGWKWLPIKAIALIATLPLFIYGYVNNFLAILIPYKVSGLFKDKQFISSVRCVVALVVFPILYLVQTLVFGLAVQCWWLTLGYLISLPVGLTLAYLWRKYFYKFMGSYRLARLISTSRKEVEALNRNFNQIYEAMVGSVKPN